MDTNEVFTLFMMSLMVGSSCFKAVYLYYEKNSFAVVKIVSCLITIAFFIANLGISYQSTLYSFLIFEVAVGMLYPTYSKIKSEHLPNKNRGTLMNIFKIPLNIIVIFLLLTMNKLFTMSQVKYFI